MYLNNVLHLHRSVLKLNQICASVGQSYVASIIEFTIKDVCLALEGVSRSRIHAWTKLPPFSSKETKERSARRFSSADLLTFSLFQTLEDTFGLRSRQLTQFSKNIHQYFSEPRSLAPVELVLIRLRDGEIIRKDITVEAGYLVDITKERERINMFLGISSPQGQLPLMSSLGRQEK